MFFCFLVLMALTEPGPSTELSEGEVCHGGTKRHIGFSGDQR